ncbi:antibiotic biosynthesis monooxygenase [Amycolatopsis albispora]|uniref:Antibiotic biosynthesis monooxygenase n=1 Tax=Amycolatopsis albispora TaxID=1804986 RepID=A0A344L2F7_9PSEU|nr:antibiotic biosynthesis monooxygenase [Amycolatopsis albispora]AXB42231.1 antibiotic biosynthesis monooxygenase [Amycolatopsis albispora]
MILRVWHGWAAGTRAAAYEELLTTEIAPGILRRGIPGLRELSVLRREPDESSVDGLTEFVTTMTFDDWAAVRTFAGDDLTGAVVPPEARALLTRFDEHSQHYELVQHYP